MFGTVMIGGHRFQVARLELRAGHLLIHAVAAGPLPAMDRQPAAVFGSDGQGVCQSWEVSIPALLPGEPVTVILAFRIGTVEVTGDPSPVAPRA